MKKYIIPLFLFLIFLSNLTFAAQEEEETFAAFEWFCLSHLNDQEIIPELFEAIEIEPLSENKAKPFLMPHDGKAWLLPGSYTKALAITLTNQGACSVTNPYINGEEARKIFEENINYKFLAKEKTGSQTQFVYEVIYPHPQGEADIHSIVIITTSNLSKIGDGIIFNAVPKDLIENLESN